MESADRNKVIVITIAAGIFLESVTGNELFFYLMLAALFAEYGFFTRTNWNIAGLAAVFGALLLVIYLNEQLSFWPLLAVYALLGGLLYLADKTVLSRTG